MKTRRIQLRRETLRHFNRSALQLAAGAALSDGAPLHDTDSNMPLYRVVGGIRYISYDGGRTWRIG